MIYMENFFFYATQYVFLSHAKTARYYLFLMSLPQEKNLISNFMYIYHFIITHLCLLLYQNSQKHFRLIRNSTFHLKNDHIKEQKDFSIFKTHGGNP